MDQQIKDKLCKQIETEIEKISNMPSLNDVTLSNLYKLIDVKKDLLEIEEKEMELEDFNQDQSMTGGSSYRMGGYSRMGNSYQQGRMGGNSNRYVNPTYYGNSMDMGYSGTGNDTYTHLEEAMRMARSEQERDEIRQLMSRLYK